MNKINANQLSECVKRCQISNSNSNRIIPYSITLNQLKHSQTLNEQTIPLEGSDKVFNSCWLPHSCSSKNDSIESLVFSTKCNRLFVMHYDPTLAQPVTRLSQLPVPNGATKTNSGGIQQTLTGGIHALAVNPSGTLLATGSAESHQLCIYRLPDMKPWLVLDGHSDTVFSCQWLSDRQLVSGSRDHHVCFWQIPDDERSAVSPMTSNPNDLSCVNIGRSSSVSQQRAMVCEHAGKVRSLQVNRRLREFMTLSADGTCKLWDTEQMRSTSTVPLMYSNETVCMAVQPETNMYAVGSQNHISLIDPRVGRPIASVESCDERFGVRSLVWKPAASGLSRGIPEQVLTIGGGMGRISFYDCRAGRYLLIDDNSSAIAHSVLSPINAATSRVDTAGIMKKNSNPLYNVGNNSTIDQTTSSKNPRGYCLQTSGGWLHRDRNYFVTESLGYRVASAVYTLSYSPDGQRLFAAGGPLQLGLRGSYAAMWE
jgi:WD repeat-containing protein 40A